MRQREAARRHVVTVPDRTGSNLTLESKVADGVPVVAVNGVLDATTRAQFTDGLAEITDEQDACARLRCGCDGDLGADTGRTSDADRESSRLRRGGPPSRLFCLVHCSPVVLQPFHLSPGVRSL